MASKDSDLTGSSSIGNRQQLDRIADMLGCPVEAFARDGAEPLGISAASELLTIWAEMDDDDDRARLLAFARQLAEGRRS